MDPIGDEILPPNYLRDYDKLGECKVWCFFLEHVAEVGIVHMAIFFSMGPMTVCGGSQS